MRKTLASIAFILTVAVLFFLVRNVVLAADGSTTRPRGLPMTVIAEIPSEFHGLRLMDTLRRQGIEASGLCSFYCSILVPRVSAADAERIIRIDARLNGYAARVHKAPAVGLIERIRWWIGR